MSGRTRIRIANAGMVWGILETSIILASAYFTSPAIVKFVPDDHTLTDRYIVTVWALAIWTVTCLAAFMGYLLMEERDGFVAFLVSQAIAFACTPGIFSRFPIANISVYFEPAFVAGFAILTILLGLLAVLAGALLRDRADPEWRIRLDWRLQAAGLLASTVAILWPLTPPLLLGYVFQGSFASWEVPLWKVPLRLADLAYPIIIVLIVLGLLLALLGLRRSTSTSFATLPLLIGSVSVGGFAIAVRGFTGAISEYFAQPAYATVPFYAAQEQSFLILGWLVVLSLSVPIVTFLGVIQSRRTRRPTSQSVSQEMTDLSQKVSLEDGSS